MSEYSNATSEQREHTDESLRQERTKTDEALATKRKHTQDLADGIVERAREQADEVLDVARDKADKKLEGAATHAESQEAVAQDRVEEDMALRQERASADSSLRWEREEQSRTLAALLPLEREKTDRYLLTERQLSDDAVDNRDDFMGMVSHDLRNLLSGIAIHAVLVSQRAPDSDEGRETIASMNRIERYVARMNRLIGDLVDVASIEAGKLAMHPQPGDVAEMISEAIATFKPVAEKKGISLAFANRGQALPATFDKERMLQVIANLIANAMRFTPGGGEVIVEAAPAGDDFHISVFDTGEGIAAEVQEAIFERFAQAGGNGHGGLGLGLYISRCIVEGHGGRIWAESNPAGTGSVFHITIPASGRVRDLEAK